MAKYVSKCGHASTSKVNRRHIASPAGSFSNSCVNLTSNVLHSGIDTATLQDFVDVKTPILDAYENYLNNPSVPLHIPGHARGSSGVLPKFLNLVGQRIINLDITDEFEQLGTLHPACGPVLESERLAAEAFGAAHTLYLVNGSTIGNLALALTVTRNAKKVIIGRNCHRSVISGITLSGADPVWIFPEKLENWGIWGPVKPESVESLIAENPEAEVVWITNPTYEGVVTDVEKIAEICRRENKILIVDEAHGCLWKFNDAFPKPALECGADAVVHSMHKTGGSFSQSSMLHLGKDSKIDYSELEANLRMLHSTSPSYMFLASLDAARAYVSSEGGKKRINNAVENANIVRHSLNTIPGVRCLGPEDGLSIDPTKIYVTVDGLSGKRLESLLEMEYHIEVESATDTGILALSNIGNTRDELEYFWECIKSIVSSNFSDISHLEKIKYMPFHTPRVVCTPREAYIREKTKINPADAIGQICAEVIAECPPGIPILVPGEMITEDHIPYLMMRSEISILK